MPRWQKTEAFANQRKTHKEHDGSDGWLVHDGPDQRHKAEPRQEHEQDAVDETADVAVTTAAVGFEGRNMVKGGIDGWRARKGSLFIFRFQCTSHCVQNTIDNYTLELSSPLVLCYTDSIKR